MIMKICGPKFIYIITQKVYASIKGNNNSTDSKFQTVSLNSYLLYLVNTLFVLLYKYTF